MLTLSAKGLKPDPTMLCNGMLAGLVAITARCAFVDRGRRLIGGAIAGWLVVESVFFFEKRRGRSRGRDLGARRERPLGRDLGRHLRDRAVRRRGGTASSVSRSSSAGSDGVRGILYGDPSQLVMQIISAVVVAVFGFSMAWVWFKISDKITPLRASPRIELEVGTGRDGRPPTPTSDPPAAACCASNPATAGPQSERAAGHPGPTARPRFFARFGRGTGHDVEHVVDRSHPDPDRLLETADHALAWAMLHAKSFGAGWSCCTSTRATCTTVRSPADERSGRGARHRPCPLDAYVTERFADSGVKVRALLEVGDPPFKIRGRRRVQADLIVMGTARAGLRPAVRQRHREGRPPPGCPVLVVHRARKPPDARCLPFAALGPAVCGLLLSIAILPLFAAHFWHRHYPLVCLVLSAAGDRVLHLRPAPPRRDRARLRVVHPAGRCSS